MNLIALLHNVSFLISFFPELRIATIFWFVCLGAVCGQAVAS